MLADFIFATIKKLAVYWWGLVFGLASTQPVPHGQGEIQTAPIGLMQGLHCFMFGSTDDMDYVREFAKRAGFKVYVLGGLTSSAYVANTAETDAVISVIRADHRGASIWLGHLEIQKKLVELGGRGL